MLFFYGERFYEVLNNSGDDGPSRLFATASGQVVRDGGVLRLRVERTRKIDDYDLSGTSTGCTACPGEAGSTSSRRRSGSRSAMR